MGERASPAIHTAHYFDTAEGTMSDLTPSAFWDEMSVAVLHSVAALLDESSMQQVRLVCKAWKQPATLATKTLRPRMTGSLGLQWHNLHQLSKAFPACRVLDLRSYKVPSDSAQHLSNTFLTTVLLSNVEADPEASRSLQELQEYMMSAEIHNPVLSFVVDIYHLPTFLSRAPFTDAECRTMMQYPASAQVVTLHLGCMPVSVTQTGLGYIAQLTTLAELSVTCCEDIDDDHMTLLSALSNLVELRLGPLKCCTSEAGVFTWGDTVALPPMGEASGLKPVVGTESGGAACGPIASVDCDGAVDGAPNSMGRESKGPAVGDMPGSWRGSGGALDAVGVIPASSDCAEGPQVPRVHCVIMVVPVSGGGGGGGEVDVAMVQTCAK
ncbi:MAG: hypothetical protein FRX49_04838 [Trebouxia sp. A1-2]|nr:MAG: hypothetical protein FRX49_04838 [Trebouxia sp. A1-2]